MKLESQLPRQSPWLYLAPLLTTILLLMVYFLLSSNFIVQSGVAIVPPDASSRLVGFESAHIITLAPGDTPRLYLDGRPIATPAALAEELLQQDHANRHALIHADRRIPLGRVMEIANIAWEQGYQVAYATNFPTATP
ncbi:MAG: biopolymer transporter ExbD [Verrucomicrobiales bacterium]|nr:biopolymer transporter ExbD [Verrucomicrobiales bacterium]